MRGGMMSSSNVGIWLLLLVAEVRGGGGFNYREALELAPLFLYAQRSGKLSDVKNKLVDWRYDSGLNDGRAQGVDLVGGYYDAGDNVKFGLPMAFTMTILSWAAIQYGGGIPQDVYANTLDAIKWGTDYFLKAHPHTKTNLLWVQVGIASSDHAKWESPERMDTPRDAFKIDESQPGSDVAAETAAALAAASMLFKSTDPSYSQTLISHALSLFEFADKHREVYLSAIQPQDRIFYKSSGYKDELLWAAAWLFRATGKNEYLEYLVLQGEALRGTGESVKEFSWDNKYAGVQVLVSTDDTIWEQSKRIATNNNKNGEVVVREYMNRAEYFLCACMQKNAAARDNVELTPQGLIYVRRWNNLEYSTGAAFLLALYSDHIASSVTCPAGVVTRGEILGFARSQADYILGNNRLGMSYLVGYGSNFPKYVHHRGASIPVQYKTSSSSSNTDWIGNPNPNPILLLGAVVGGPDANDNFEDKRDNYEQTEATMNTAATMYGLLAKLSSSSSSNQQQQEQQQSVVSVAHAVISTWSVGKTQYCRHRVVLENTSHKDKVKDLRLRIDHLSARPFGLTQVLHDDDKNDDDDTKPQIFVLPKWTNSTINPRSKHTFVYVQQCAQAKITLLSYTTT
ncbi:hypothetical protein DM860_010356 [Cuscuta australis]|uniref:Endoglucanase n=1 Tax=Cuscuta australis TaxID=267555 RepID=A0A328E4L9_9ASTE|nr:hypothetical protein DM860_010356 [Cuscuta australis]